MKRATRGMGRIYQRGGVWWIQYSHNGKRRRESSGSAKRPVAVDLLKKRHQELASGRTFDEARRVTLQDLRDLLANDYELNRRRSWKRAEQSWVRIASFFGKTEPAVAVTAARLASYVQARTGAGASPGTIKVELSALKRAFNLARKAGALLASEVPSAFPSIAPSRPRQGFLEREEHERLRAALPTDAGDVAEFLFWTGWRKGEALGLRWSHVDERAGVLRIETTKSGEPRTLPYAALPQLAELLMHRRTVTEAVQKKRGMVVSHVFHRNGEPIRHFRRTWMAACVAAGLGHERREKDTKTRKGKVRKGRLLERVAYRIPHDYRRSAARNLSRAGVPERVIMQLCGWKTRSVFDRYRIVPERELAEGLAKLAGPAPAADPPKVASISSRK